MVRVSPRSGLVSLLCLPRPEPALRARWQGSAPVQPPDSTCDLGVTSFPHGPRVPCHKTRAKRQGPEKQQIMWKTREVPAAGNVSRWPGSANVPLSSFRQAEKKTWRQFSNGKASNFSHCKVHKNL